MDINKFKTEQEKFWSGQFGDQYTDRNQTEQLLERTYNFLWEGFKIRPEQSKNA